MSDNSDKPDARARAELIPQPHGGALMPPWKPGRKSVTPKSWRERQAALLQVLDPASDEVAEGLRDIATSAPDLRDRIVAGKLFFDLLREGWQAVGEQSAPPDLSRLTPEERAELGAAMAVVRRLAARAQGVVDGDAG